MELNTSPNAPSAGLPPLENMLADQVVLVTGGSRGLGRALGLAFAAAGAKVAFTYIQNEPEAGEAREQIAAAAAGVRPLVFRGDVSDAAHARETVGAVVKEWGRIDALVNNAAINQMMPLALLDESDWERLMAVNLKGAFLFSRAALKHMIRAGGGRILNLGSFASERVTESPLHYAASKSGLRGFTEALAYEVGRHQVLVNMISPGLLEDGMSTTVPRHRAQEYTEQNSLGRVARADEIARTAVFLVSRYNTFMTGAKLVMDGGL